MTRLHCTLAFLLASTIATTASAQGTGTGTGTGGTTGTTTTQAEVLGEDDGGSEDEAADDTGRSPAWGETSSSAGSSGSSGSGDSGDSWDSGSRSTARSSGGSGGGGSSDAGGDDGDGDDDGDGGPGTYGTEGRPGQTFGIGAGYTFPGDIRTPNTVAARFRFDGGLTLEPSLTFRFTGSKDDPGGPGSSETQDLTVAFGTQLRMPLVSAGPFDLLFLINAGVSITNELEPGDVLTVGLNGGYGLGMEFWISEHWTVSLDASNPAISFSHTNTDNGFTTDKVTNYSVGAIWNPSVRLIMSMYF